MRGRIVTCGSHRAALTQWLVCQPSTLGMPVRFRRAAPSAASIKVMHRALTRGTGTVTLAAHSAGVTGTWHTRSAQIQCPSGRFESLLTRTQWGMVNPAARSALNRSVQVRILIPQLTPPRTAAAPPSYGGWPGSAPGGGSSPRSPTAGGASIEALAVCVRIAPMTTSTGVSTENLCSVKRKRPPSLVPVPCRRTRL